MVTQLASAYQPTYNSLEAGNGVYRDRYVRPHNMDDLHWKYSKKSGITPLKPEEAHEKTKNAKLVLKVGQGLWDDLGSAFEKAEEIVVHTITAPAVTLYKQGENVVKTVEHIATDATNTISHIAEDEIKGIVKTGNNIVHGNISGAFSDVIHMESAVVSDVFTGGENIVSDVAEGGGNALVITFKAAEGDVQYILDNTGKLGEAIKGFLKQVELEAEDLLAWLAEELGWDDILKVQKYIERVFNDGMDKIPDIINTLKTQIDAGFKTIKTDLDLNIQQARKYFGANSNLFTQGEHDPAALDKASEHTDWLMSKVTSDSDTSVSNSFVVPEPPKDLLGVVEDLFKTLSDKVGNDTTLKNAIKNLKEDFQYLFQGSLLDAPNKMILIVLDLVEIIADVAIDIVNTVVDVVLDCFSALLKWFKETLNTPIELPFITDIYKKLTNEEQLTILSFSSLIIAIPAKFIAELSGYNLANMKFSTSQGLTEEQHDKGIWYGTLQIASGIISSILHLFPPVSLQDNLPNQNQVVPEDEGIQLANQNEQVQQAPNLGQQGAPNLSLNSVATNLLNLSSPYSRNCCVTKTLPFSLLVIGGFQQAMFGTPSGDLEFYKDKVLFGANEKNFEKCLDGIWIYQWLLWLYSLTGLLCPNRYEDCRITIQVMLEILHEVGFITYGVMRTRDNSPWNKINTAYIMDPFRGFLEIGRTEYMIKATKGLTYPLVPIIELCTQSAYGIIYIWGIEDQS